MSVTQKIVTSNFNVHNAQEFVRSFEDGGDYFIFAGKHMPYPNSDANITIPDNSDRSKTVNIYNDMIFAKRVQSTDVVHMIPKYMWTSNTYFHEYDDTDPDLLTKQFYTVVDDDTEYNVYKCLFNNSNTSIVVNSTIAPSRVGSSADLNPIITGDGYVWKYMYTITKTQYEKFSTAAYVPVIANTDVVSNATPGTIEVIKVITPGAGYNNYIASGTFQTGDINIGGVNTIYGAPVDAEAIDDYYQGCVIKITSGVGVDQYRRIVNYEGVGTQKKFILDSPFLVAPEVNDTYEVYPYIYVWGDGSESIPAEARAIIDPAGNTISQVEMLAVGKGYRTAEGYPSEMPDTIPVSINSIYIQLPEVVSQDVNFKPAVLRPILSPRAGHGADPLNELGAKRVCISTKFVDSESGTIPTENDFRQVGLIKNPKFTNVDLILKGGSTIGNFSIGETVYQYRQLKLLGNVNVTATSNVILKTDQGKISSTIQILNAGQGYDSSVNNALVFTASDSGTGAAGTFTANLSIVAQANIQSNTSITSGNFINLSGAATTFGEDRKVKYYTVDSGTAGINGLANNSYYYVLDANSSGMRLSQTQGGIALTITANTSDTGNVNFAWVNGAILSTTVTNQGQNYTVAPTVEVNTQAAAGASNGQFEAAIANEQNPSFKDSFEVGDYVLVSSGTENFLSTVAGVPYDYQITCTSNSLITANNAEVSALILGASGKVTSVSTGQVTLSNVSGVFSETSKIVGTSSGATAVIVSSNSSLTAIQINDKAAGSFTSGTQLTRLVGDFVSGSVPFIEDEAITQESLIAYAKPRGFVHHAEINSSANDDILYISNEFGIFNLDPLGVRTIAGNTSGATLDYLTNKYPGDFVKDSGEVLYYENLDPIKRSDNKSEIIKIILEF